MSRPTRGTNPSKTAHSVGLVFALALVLAATPADASARQDCEVRCGLALGFTSFTVATGLAVAHGRVSGGLTEPVDGLLTWGAGFTLTLGLAVALAGEPDRQERAVYAATLGTVAGAVTGLTLETLGLGGEEPAGLAAALIGAAVGGLVGGAYGALTHDDDGPAPGSFQAGLPFTARIAF